MIGDPIMLIGAGRMGGALLRGWLRNGIGPIVVVEPRPSPFLLDLQREERILLVRNLNKLNPDWPRTLRPKACVIAIKPQDLKKEATSLKRCATRGTLMISIAAGTHSASLAKAWGTKSQIIRAMPNTPGSIGRGISGLYAMKGATQRNKYLADKLLLALGKTIWVKKEELIDVVTAVSGSGPAYLFLMVESLTRAGMVEGLPYQTANELARATVVGAGYLLDEDKHAASTLRRNVTSPGGTTEAAMDVLRNDKGLTYLMIEAVKAARKRAEELR